MAVAVGQVDVAIGALSVTPERQAIANFSNVYYAGSDAVLSRPEADPKNLQKPEALAAARLGVQMNSIYETYSQQQLIDTGKMPKQNLYSYPDITQAVNDLKDKRIDAVWLDLNPAQTFVTAGGVKILAQDLNQQLYAIGMMKGADALRDKINEALTLLQNDGALANLQVQYLGIKPEDVATPQPLPTTTPQPTSVPPSCLDAGEWKKDLSYDDNNHKDAPVLKPGEVFTKGWRLKNIGSCTWKKGYVLAYTSGNVPAAQMGGQPIPVTKDVKPGETFDFQVNLVAPVKPGRYQGYWDPRNAQNKKFSETVWVDIIVSSGATPTPEPTQTPVPNIYFEADPTSITEGQAVLFEWATENAKFVYFYHDGQKWSEQEVKKSGQSTEYPLYSMHYYLNVYLNDNTIVERKIYITVKPADNSIEFEYITASPPQIILGESTRIDWSIKGKVDQVVLLVDNVVVDDSAPASGNYVDTPKDTGTHVYTVQASGPGGTVTGQASVNVQVPPTEEPEEPTVTPEPTEEPQPDPPVVNDFKASPTTIEQGGCVTLSWTTGGGTTQVELSRDGGVIWTGSDLNGSLPDCDLSKEPTVVQYTLVARNNAGVADARDATVQVTGAPPQNPLADTSWQLQNMQGAGDVPADVAITAYFGAGGGLSGIAGCNPYSGSYTADGQSIAIRNVGAEGNTCGDPADSLERAYLELLPQVANFEINGGQLVLMGNQGQPILRFIGY
jgi:heat shock protein HslJ